MIKKFFCWLWGHKVLLKALTGNISVVGYPLYRWERQEYCIRCGVKNKD